jgi:hypothetical protein
MSTVLTSLVAIVGTLLGSLSTYVFQQRIAARAKVEAREERLRQERVAAYSAYATAITELKRGAIAAWFQRADLEGPAFRAAIAESDRLGAVAEAARFRLRLLDQDADLSALADAAFGQISTFKEAADRTELRGCEAAFEAAVGDFIAAAAARLA